ncbi:MAG: RluA family pseudouridine synthase [Patescibacteria group bacterium]
MNVEPSIIYENEDILVIDKPVGLIVHGDGRTKEPTLAEWLLARYPALSAVGEPWTSPQGEIIPRPGIVHRLDRTTSGVMVVAKTAEAHAFLKEGFQKRTIAKEYLAYVYGHPKVNDGIIEAEIRRTRTSPPRWTAEPGRRGGHRAAVTHWEVVERGTDAGNGDKVSLLRVMPKTGRTHQIRVHLKIIHHAVVADPLYAPGQPALLGFERPALHARSLSVTLPSGERKEFEAALPSDFEAARARFVPREPE